MLTGNDPGAAKRLAAALEGGAGSVVAEALNVVNGGGEEAEERLKTAKERAAHGGDAAFKAAKDYQEDCLTDLYVGTAGAPSYLLSRAP